MSGRYTDQDRIRLGFKQLDQWLDKADRELARFADAGKEDAQDHAANLAWTIAHIEDWFYHHCQLPAANVAAMAGVAARATATIAIGRARRLRLVFMTGRVLSWTGSCGPGKVPRARLAANWPRA